MWFVKERVGMDSSSFMHPLETPIETPPPKKEGDENALFEECT